MIGAALVSRHCARCPASRCSGGVDRRGSFEQGADGRSSRAGFGSTTRSCYQVSDVIAPGRVTRGSRGLATNTAKRSISTARSRTASPVRVAAATRVRPRPSHPGVTRAAPRRWRGGAPDPEDPRDLCCRHARRRLASSSSQPRARHDVQPRVRAGPTRLVAPRELSDFAAGAHGASGWVRPPLLRVGPHRWDGSGRAHGRPLGSGPAARTAVSPKALWPCTTCGPTGVRGRRLVGDRRSSPPVTA